MFRRLFSAGAWRLRAADRGCDLGVGWEPYNVHGSRLYCPRLRSGSGRAVRSAPQFPRLPSVASESRRLNSAHGMWWLAPERATEPLVHYLMLRGERREHEQKLLLSHVSSSRLSRGARRCHVSSSSAHRRVPDSAPHSALLLAALLLCCSPCDACVSRLSIYRREMPHLLARSPTTGTGVTRIGGVPARCVGLSRALGWIPRGRRSKP